MESKDYAKEVEGLGLADVLSLVKEALDDKYMYSFGELLARKEVQEVGWNRMCEVGMWV